MEKIKLEIKALNNATLELHIGMVRPQLAIGELDLGDECYPWHAHWQNLIITDFGESYEAVKGRVKKFYEEENLNEQPGGHTIRKPCIGKLKAENEEWTLHNTRIMGCKFEDRTKKITLELTFDGVQYQNFKEEK